MDSLITAFSLDSLVEIPFLDYLDTDSGSFNVNGFHDVLPGGVLGQKLDLGVVTFLVKSPMFCWMFIGFGCKVRTWFARFTSKALDDLPGELSWVELCELRQ